VIRCPLQLIAALHCQIARDSLSPSWPELV
jgi:hypothetical protein